VNERLWMRALQRKLRRRGAPVRLGLADFRGMATIMRARFRRNRCPPPFCADSSHRRGPCRKF